MISRFAAAFCATAAIVLAAMPVAAEETLRSPMSTRCPAAERASGRSA